MERKTLWYKGIINKWLSAFLLLIIACLMIIYFLSVKESNLFFEWKYKDFYNHLKPNESLNPHETILLNKTELTAFKDDLFAPMLSLFLRKARGELQPKMKSFRTGSIPRVLLWARPFENSYWESQFAHISNGLCPLPCDIIFDEQKKDTVDAVIIHLRDTINAQTVTESLAPRDLRQPWIMLAHEAPYRANSRYNTEYKNFNGLFNRTMTYRYDSDIRVSHGFIVRRGEDARSLSRPWVVPPLMNVGNQSRKLAVSFISNCNSETNRLLYIHNIQQYAPVDIYGACGKLKCGHTMYVEHRYNSTEDECLKIAGENYLFFFAFENSFCKDYLTEKAYNLLYYPIVPVVRGSADYATLFPPNSYIDATKYSPKDLAEKLLFLQKHPQEYQKYLAWRHYYQPSTIGGERILCHLCARLYDPDFYQHQVIEDFVDWFVAKAHCREELIL